MMQDMLYFLFYSSESYSSERSEFTWCKMWCYVKTKKVASKIRKIRAKIWQYHASFKSITLTVV